MTEQDRSHSVRRAQPGDVSRAPTISGCQDELRGSATVRRRSGPGVPTWCRRCSGPGPGSLSCRLFVGADLGDDGFGDPLPGRPSPACASADRERDVLADHLPVLRGRSRHEFDVDVPLGNVAQPRGLVQGTDISRGQRTGTCPARPGPGGASTASAAMACMAIVVHGFSPGPAHTDEHTRPPGLSTRANSAVALARSERTCTRTVPRYCRMPRHRMAAHRHCTPRSQHW